MVFHEARSTVRRHFGLELVLDLYGCDPKLFSKKCVNSFFKRVCREIGMKRHGTPVFWHDDGNQTHLPGLSAMQFISTSSITIHAVDSLATIYVNLFSCKKFNAKKAAEFTKKFFKAEKAVARVLERK